MNGISTITTKGQVTVPSKLRRYLDVAAGDRLYFEVDPNHKAVSIKKLEKPSIVAAVAGSLRSPVGYVPLAKVRQAAGKKLGGFYQRK